MKRILFISAFPPNRKTAGQNYTRQLLNDLVDNYEIDLISFDYEDHEVDLKDSVNNLMVIPRRGGDILSFLLAPFFFPLFTRRFKFGVLKKIRKLAPNYDYLYFDFSQVFFYSLLVSHPSKILMAHDVIYQKFNRKKNFFWNIIIKTIKGTEKLLLNSASDIFCFSAKDKTLIKECYGLDSTPVSFYIDPVIINKNTESTSIGDFFVFYGAWNRTENSYGLKWFLENVYENISPAPVIKIIGGGLSSELIDLVSGYNLIIYLGFVDDPYSIICESQALIAPVFAGAGVKVKVIEALATGTPIIGTSIAFEGIESLKDTKLNMMVLSETANDFVNAISSYKKINVQDKVSSKEKFLNSYSLNKFSDIIEKL